MVHGGHFLWSYSRNNVAFRIWGASPTSFRDLGGGAIPPSPYVEPPMKQTTTVKLVDFTGLKRTSAEEVGVGRVLTDADRGGAEVKTAVFLQTSFVNGP